MPDSGRDFGAAHDPYAALRHPDFRRLLIASMLATIGQEMQAVALGWELYERTGSELALGLVGLVLVVPVVFLALPAGQVADRWPRKWVAIGARMTMAVSATGLALASASGAPVGVMYAWLAMAGCSTAFVRPAIWALVPQLIPPAEFSNAVTWRSSGMQIATVVGPALGGVGIALARSAAPVYALHAVLCLITIQMLLRLKPGPRPGFFEPPSFRTMLAGVRYVLDTRLILATITLDMFAVLLGGATMLLPVFAKDILHVGPVGLGWLRAAPSLGAMAMALTLAHRRPLRRSGRAMLLAVAGFGVATIIFGVTTNPFVAFAALLAAGALDNVSVVVRGTLVQLLTPDAMRGRVSAVNSVFIGLSNELGGFESGLTASWWGPVGAVIFGGFGCIAVVGAVAWRWPDLWRLGPLASVRSYPPETAEVDEPSPQETSA